MQEIEDLRDALLTRILPALPNAEQEADAYTQEMWDWAMAQPSDGSDDPGTWAEWAKDRGIEKHERLQGVEQSVLNMGTVMLWHLLEQQMLTFHMRQVVKIHEEQEALSDPEKHKKIYSLFEFKKRLRDGGYPVEKLAAWSKVDELRLVANTVKHAAGDSARKLHACRPDLFIPPGFEDWQHVPTSPYRVERPAGGADIFVTVHDLVAYFEAAISFWVEFCTVINHESSC